MSTQHPALNAATPPLLGFERRFLDNKAPQQFRGPATMHPQRGQAVQHAYVPTSSEALGPPPPITENWLQRTPSMAPVTEPRPPPRIQVSGSRLFAPADASGCSPETITSGLKRDASLAQLILDAPEKNIERVDGRHRTPIPIISGARERVTLETGQKVGIDTSSLLVLSHLSLLREVFRTFQNIVLAPDIENELQEHIDETSTRNPLLAEQIEELASEVSKFIKSKTAPILGQSISDLGRQEFGFNHNAEDVFVLMASECDVVCIDDPRFNCCNNLRDNDGHSSVSVACTDDVLRALVETDTITKHDYWMARHKLREFGFIAIMPDADELHHWLKESFTTDQEMRESIELRTIRHSMAIVAQNCEFNTRETNRLLRVSTDVCGEAVSNLWDDESISVPKASLGSDWIWNHISPLRCLGGLSITSNTIRMTAIRSVAYFLIPRDRKQDREAKYIGWVAESVLPIFQCANPSVIDESLDLIAESILHSDQHDDAYGHMFLKQLPNVLINRLLDRRSEFGDKWGFQMSRSITFDSGPSILITDLIRTARKAYAENTDVRFTDDSGRSGVILLDQQSKSVSVEWADESGRQRRMPMLQLMLLCPADKLRLGAAQSIVQFIGATAGDKRHLLEALESRPATDEEMSQVSSELSNGMKARQEKLHGRVLYHRNIDVDDVSPPLMQYFERLVGPHPIDAHPDTFVQDVIIPYRKRLLNLDLKSGLELACLGFLNDSLAPGEWVEDFSNDEVWEALSRFNYSASPFVLLAALDVALYRQEDQRYQELAVKAVNGLYDRSFGRSGTFDTYEALHVVIELVENRLNTLESGAIKLECWKRVAAWMQAALFVGYLGDDGSPENMDSLREFGASNMTVAGRYARIAGARNEPLAFAARTTGDLLHTYLVERLKLLMSRHRRLGHPVPRPNGVGVTFPSLGAIDESAILGLPGPLDGHRIPTRQVPPDLAERRLASADPDSADFPWQTFVTLSQTHELDASQLAVFRAAVDELVAGDAADRGSAELMQCTDYSSMVAAARRDSALADAVADLLLRLAAAAHDPSQLPHMIGCLLQTAAAHSDQNAWSEWLEERLAQIASQLPPPPSESSRVFAELLDELGSVLPVESWVHLRARAICGCIAPAAPRFHTDFIEEGWLGDALESLEGIREEALLLGFDAPSDIAIRSARAFLEPLAQVVRQTPDVQPLQDGEIGIDFYNQTERGGVLFVVESDGSGACYTVANGVSRTFIRSSYKDLLDDEIGKAVTATGVG